MYSAGLRVSEVVGLDDGDLDFDGGVLRVRGKGRRERLAPIGSYAMRAMRRWLGVRRAAEERVGRPCTAVAIGRSAKSTCQRFTTPVFVNRFGRRLTTRSVARMLEKYLILTGLDRRTSPHSLRHSFARTC